MSTPAATFEVAEVVVAADGTVTRATAQARELLCFDGQRAMKMRELIGGFPATMWFACGVGAVVRARCKGRDLVVEVVRAGPDGLTLAIEARREEHPVEAHLNATSCVVAELAHEVNNALTSIVAALDTTLEFEEISPGARALLSTAHSEVLRVAKIIARGRTQSLRREPDIGAVDVRRELDSVLRPMQGFLGRREINVLVEIPDELAAIHSDPSWLIAMLQNLLANARDALATRGSLLQVRVDRLPGDVDVDRPWLAMTVRDDGIGMKREDLLRAGDLLFTNKTHGKGLGLATVGAMAASLSGSLLLRSTEGRGTIASAFFADRR